MLSITSNQYVQIADPIHTWYHLYSDASHFFQLTIFLCLIEVAHSTTEYIVDDSLLNAEELNIAAVVVIEELKEGTTRVDGNRTWIATPGSGRVWRRRERREKQKEIFMAG